MAEDSPREQRAGFDRLRELPEVFNRAQAEKLTGLAADSLSVTLARWHQRGWIKSAGRRSEVYYNLLRNPDAPDEKLATVIQHLYPTALVLGASTLHAHGWTTQIPQAVTVAILSRRSRVPVDGADLTERPRGWFMRYRRGILPAHKSPTYGIRSLRPEYALADMIERATVLADDTLEGKDSDWIPDPDDLYLDEDATERVRGAFEELGVEIPEAYRSTLGWPNGPKP